MSTSQSLRLGFEAADSLLRETDDVYQVILDSIADPRKYTADCTIGLLVSIRTSNKEKLAIMLKQIPQTTSNYIFRTCLILGLAFRQQQPSPEVIELINQLSLSKLEKLAPYEILLWAYSTFIVLGIDKETNLQTKASTLINTHFPFKEVTNFNSYEQFMLESIQIISSREIQSAFSTGKYSRCLTKAQPTFKYLIMPTKNLNLSYFDNNEFKIILDLVFKALILQSFQYSKFNFINFMKPVFVNTSLNSEILHFLYSNVNIQLLNLVAQMCTSRIIPITDDIIALFSNLFSTELQKTAIKSLLEVNIISISFQFSNIRFSTLTKLLQMEEHKHLIDLFELIIDLKARKVLLVDINESERILVFKHSKVDQKKLKNQVLYDLKNINIDFLRKYTS